MWSGTTLTNFSGNIFGVHQKVERVAYRVLRDATKVSKFPDTKTILYFEGRNGPDGIKAKSPAVDEPWHYIDPFDPLDTQLLQIIKNHHQSLTNQLKAGNTERAGFEAAWLAHALVDGLTPAHHFPYEETLVELRKGEGIETRTSIKEKLVMKGDTKTELVRNNWRMWGFKGLIVSHGAYELGVAAIVAPLRFRQVRLTKQLISDVEAIGFEEYYLQTLREIALWRMYEDFTRFGWTWSLSKRTRDELMPKIIEAVAVAWYVSLKQAGLAPGKLK